MIVNSSHNPLIYGSAAVFSGQERGGNTLPGSTTKAASTADQVTLSNEGQALAADKSDVSTPYRTAS
jgi:hypothetical protein